MRVASLLATGTEIVYALGMGQSLVAISHECDYPPEVRAKPRVSRPRFAPGGRASGEIDRLVRETMAQHGSVYELDTARLRVLSPDLLLAQAVCDVCAVPMSAATVAAESLGGTAHVVSLDAHTVADILHCIRMVGDALDVGQRADALVADLEQRIAAVEARVAGAPRPTVLALEWLDPPFLPGHWTPEMIERAGGIPLAAAAGSPSRAVSWGELASLDPDVLLVVPCGYGLEAARRDADRATTRLVEVARRAVRNGRAFVADGSAYFNRSGPRVVDGIEILAALVHPGRAGDVMLEGRAAPWTPARRHD